MARHSREESYFSALDSWGEDWVQTARKKYPWDEVDGRDPTGSASLSTSAFSEEKMTGEDAHVLGTPNLLLVCIRQCKAFSMNWHSFTPCHKILPISWKEHSCAVAKVNNHQSTVEASLLYQFIETSPLDCSLAALKPALFSVVAKIRTPRINSAASDLKDAANKPYQ